MQPESASCALDLLTGESVNPVEVALEKFGALGSLFSCPGHTDLCREGVQPGSVHVLAEGAVILKSANYEGKEYIAGLRSPTCVLGADCVSLGVPSRFTVTTVGRCTR
jgi:hypothetical protein